MWRNLCAALARHEKRSLTQLVGTNVFRQSAGLHCQQALYRVYFTLSKGYFDSLNGPTLGVTQVLQRSGFAACESLLAGRSILRLRNMGQLKVESPVPSDIVIAQATKPNHIAEIAKSIGLDPHAYDLYGTTKAKASVVSATFPKAKPSQMHATAMQFVYERVMSFAGQAERAEQACFCLRRKIR